VKARAYQVLEMAVENGINAGWRHAYKHRPTAPPEEEAEEVRGRIFNDVMSEICEWFTFEAEPEA
jgi:hypothetical protein